MEKTSLFPQLPESTKLLAIEYEANTNNLINYVNDGILARDDFEELVGSNGIDLMKTNHLNHTRIIKTVLALQRTDILDVTLPWVYRVYHNHGFSYDYFPVALEIWIEAIEKYLRREQAEIIVKLYQWMIAQHKKNIEQSVNYFPAEYNIESKWKICYSEFLAALNHGNAFNCSEVAEHCCSSRDSVVSFYINVAQPALYKIGDLWETGTISVAEEHLATAIVSRIISQFSFRFRNPVSETRRAVVLSITGDHHQVGAQMVASSLELAGWDVVFLGDSMPMRDIIRHVTANFPRLLAISVTMLYNLESAYYLINKIKKSPTLGKIKILVGGLAFTALPDLVHAIGADGYAASCQEAEEWCLRNIVG